MNLDFAVLKGDEPTLADVIKQLERDLEMSGNAFQFKKKEVHALIEELEKELTEIEKRGLLNSLVYRVDINMEKVDMKQFHYSLSVLIWNRCLQKVWFRKNYA